MAETKVPQTQLNLSKTTDANGWTVYDYGAWKQYKKRVTFSQTVTAAAVLSLSSHNLPAGVPNYTGHFIDFATTTTGSAFAFIPIPEIGTGSTTLNFTVRSNDGISRTYNGWIDITLTGM